VLRSNDGRQRIRAGLDIAQLNAALAVADRVVDFAGIKMRDFERVEHIEVFAVPQAGPMVSS
jgi:hypothetical protein